MKPKSHNQLQTSFLLNGLKEQLDPRQSLYKLGQILPWHEFEEEFNYYYSKKGRPAKSIRLMVSLLILKQLYNVSDQAAFQGWIKSPYWQFFS